MIIPGNRTGLFLGSRKLSPYQKRCSVLKNGARLHLFKDFLKAQEYSLLISSIAPSGTHRTSYFTDSV
ncbi:hypothetical protein EUQ16_07515 [Salmonella enterica subsp. enterica serovar Newport]|uniref:Uncharacterized protein n=1 Tax=Salmonella newport TaxID=108619 RepID=A0A3U2ZRS8_SALNE|nr:hypothetical protein SEETMRM10961_1515 [Salmonella enterica subsp. enterica serovar Typhimurium]EAA3764169.1 hypothetical protein [Salmonella enterica subsp. enterica serovar Newport]EAA7578898.1 hypothetical protein [Salmonella enterica subsp. enterica]EAM3039470.1 hypothetical protein [Salmonella enterica]EAA5416895.1 hypothetical protein [Salmonella enterica subsp. enterica serovar Newport]